MKMMNKIACAVAIIGSTIFMPAISASAEAETDITTTEAPSVTSTVSSEVVEETTITLAPPKINIEKDIPDIEDDETEIPAGNGRLIEDVLDGDVNRQFLTIQSKNGNTFYIIVDKDSKGKENVYFMNLVDEYDLMAFADKFPDAVKEETEEAEQPVVTDKNGKPVETTIKTDDKSNSEASERTSNSENNGGNNNMLLILIGVVVLGGGAAFYFFKVKGKPKDNKKIDIDEDEDEYDDEPTVSDEDNNDE